MKKINVGSVFPIIALIILILALSQQISSVPPLGKLLDPFMGAVQNDDQQLNATQSIISELKLFDSVQV